MDFREEILKDVIKKLEPDLFKRVTGFLVKGFELLVSLGLFKEEIMNEAVYKFIRGVKYIKLFALNSFCYLELYDILLCLYLFHLKNNVDGVLKP